MAERGDDAQNTGIGDENVQLAPAFENRSAQPVDCLHVCDVEGNEGRRAACRLNGIVQFFKAAHRACTGNHMRTGFGERQCREIADTTRRAGDQRDPAVQVNAHIRPTMNDPAEAICSAGLSQPLLARTETFRPIVSAALSSRRVG